MHSADSFDIYIGEQERIDARFTGCVYQYLLFRIEIFQIQMVVRIY